VPVDAQPDLVLVPRSQSRIAPPADAATASALNLPQERATNAHACRGASRRSDRLRQRRQHSAPRGLHVALVITPTVDLVGMYQLRQGQSAAGQRAMRWVRFMTASWGVDVVFPRCAAGGATPSDATPHFRGV
jgi:hypothetical protein